MEVVSEKGKEVWRYRGRTYLMDLEPQEIVSRYNTEIRGFYKYYSIANNASALGRSFGCIMKFSMFKTLAMKWNCSVRAVTNKLREDDNFVVWFTDKKGERKPRVFYNEGFRRLTDLGTAKYDNLPYMFITPSMSLIERLLAGKCELCGKEAKVEVHHVRKLSELKGKTEWERRMLKMHRKTLIVCAGCHSKIHSD